MGHAYIYDAVRTPRGKGRASKDGKPGGSLSNLHPHELVAQLVLAVSERNGPDAIAKTERLLLGCVGQIHSQGGHIALVSKLASALDNDVAAKTINNYCVSGLTAVSESAHYASAGASGLSLAGGVEMLSQVPFLADGAEFTKGGPVSESLGYIPPILGAELVASLEGYTKEDLDDITLRSHHKAHSAWENGRYDTGVITVKNRDGEPALERDEWINPELTRDQLASMPPAFASLGHGTYDERMLTHFPHLAEVNYVHSVSNTPGLSDGAALVLTGSAAAGEAAGLKPKARIRASVDCGGDPILQFGAGFQAMETALARTGLTLDQLDLIEFMEAFASVPLRFEREYAPDLAKVNVNGGHLAMGHPMGATGAILTTTLLHELERRDEHLGMVVASAANGIGSALIIERC
ncbi:MAG: acetyl-CoA C-acyltransferase [Henriciella sp.]